MFKIATADLDRANTAALADDSELIFLGVAAGNYQFQAFIDFRSAGTTGGFKWAMRISNAPTRSLHNTYVTDVNDTFQIAKSIPQSMAVSPGSVAFVNTVANDDVGVHLFGFVIVASTSDIALQWAQSTSNGTNSTRRRGSFLALTPIT